MLSELLFLVFQSASVTGHKLDSIPHFLGETLFFQAYHSTNILLVEQFFMD